MTFIIVFKTLATLFVVGLVVWQLNAGCPSYNDAFIGAVTGEKRVCNHD